ncbi:MAG: hypothetical protein NT023_05430 [Armatimonadetes bacterium]|nr:hypothetical protein [Armatimonadota bacterium]
MLHLRQFRLLIACTATVLLNSAATNSMSQQTAKRVQPAVPARSLAQYVEDYDKFAQERFQMDDTKVFGTIRMVVIPPKLDNLSRKYDTPMILMDSVIGFYHTQPKPNGSPSITTKRGISTTHIFFEHALKQTPFHPSLEYLDNGAGMIPSPISLTPPKDFAKWKRENDKAVSDACAKALAQCKAGKSVNVNIAKHQILFRPVMAKSKTCISCHTTNKVGDTLGVLFYVIPAK